MCWPRPALSRHEPERLVGKCSFAHSAAPAQRSVFQGAYRWLAEAREHRVRLVVLPQLVVSELLFALALLPACQFSM